MSIPARFRFSSATATDAPARVADARELRFRSRLAMMRASSLSQPKAAGEALPPAVKRGQPVHRAPATSSQCVFASKRKVGNMRVQARGVSVLGVAVLLLYLTLMADIHFTSAAIVQPEAAAVVTNMLAEGGTFTPSPLNFGDVPLGETRQLPLKFKNTSTVDIRIDFTQGPNPDHPVNPDITGFNARDAAACIRPLSPNDECTMQITFTALRLGSAGSTLALLDYYTNGITYSVALLANGVALAPTATLAVTAATGGYSGNADLTATLAGCSGGFVGHTVGFTLATPAGSRTISATTGTDGVATVSAARLAVDIGGVLAPISVGVYGPTDAQGVRAAFAGDSTCTAASGAATLTVTPATPVISFVEPGGKVYGDTPFALDVTSTGGGADAPAISLAYGPSTVCSGPATLPAAVTIIGAGTCTITASQPAAGDTNYADAAPVIRAITIARATPAIVWAAPAAIGYGTPLGETQLNATSVISGTFSYSPPAATVLGAGAGRPLAVTFTPTAGDNYAQATGAVSLTVERAPLTIAVRATSGEHGLPLPPVEVTFDRFVNGETEAVLVGPRSCTTAARSTSPPGDYPVECSGQSSANYLIAYQPGTLTITRGTTATIPARFAATYGDPGVAVTATVSAAVAVGAGTLTFELWQGDTRLVMVGPVAVVGGAGGVALPLVGIGAGDYRLVALYGGGANLLASDGTVPVQIGKAAQAITFGPLAERIVGGTPFALAATADSGLLIGFTAAPAASCTVSGVTVTLREVGTCAIVAAQAGGANHHAAPSVTRSFAIVAASSPAPSPSLTPSPAPSPSVVPAPSPSVIPALPPSGKPSPAPVPSTSPARHTLALTTTGAGSATAATPGPSYPAGAAVALTAIPAPGQLFLGWTVDGRFQGWQPRLTVIMRADRAVSAAFGLRPVFTDGAMPSPASGAIGELAARGIVRGYDDGSFGPADHILRAQMAGMIVRALGWDGTPGGPARFADRDEVDGELWRAVGLLAARGVARGYEDGTYRPLDPVSHIQAISFVTRAMIADGHWQPQPDNGTRYPVVPAASGHRQDLATFMHYVGGIPGVAAAARWDGPEGWDQPATRAWFARALWAALDSAFGVEREV